MRIAIITAAALLAGCTPKWTITTGDCFRQTNRPTQIYRVVQATEIQYCYVAVPGVVPVICTSRRFSADVEPAVCPRIIK